jgi:hypothetical protein
MLAPMLFGDGHATHTYVQDAEALAAPGEQLSWWQLMVRAGSAHARPQAQGLGY